MALPQKNTREVLLCSVVLCVTTSSRVTEVMLEVLGSPQAILFGHQEMQSLEVSYNCISMKVAIDLFTSAALSVGD